MMNNEKEQITKNQHYVPQFYLRKFVNSEGKLEILDCELRKCVVARTPKSVCNEEYFYSANNELDEASQVLEKELQRIETDISRFYDEIVKKILDFKEITPSDKMTISTFLSMQYLRGPYMRKQIKKMDESIIKQITKIRYGSEAINHDINKLEKEKGETISQKEREDLINFALSGDYRVETNNVGHLNMLGEIEGFRNLFFGKEWLIYISKSSKKFITSDNPVVEIFPDWNGKFFYGPTFLQRTHQFAMTPEILIVATHPRNSPAVGQIKRKTLFDNAQHNDKILELNFQHPRNATEYAYASDKMFLQEIIDSANQFDKQKIDTILKIARSN